MKRSLFIFIALLMALLFGATSKATTFYHADGNGNITALMDANQNIVGRYLYNPFGKLIGKWGVMADVNEMRFSSMPYDGLAGISFFPLRPYDPNLQRWLGQDPIQEAGGISLYQFVYNNPINEIDPFGLWTFGIGLQFSGELALALGGSGGFYIGRNPDNGHWSVGFLFGPSGGAGGPASLGGGVFAQVTTAKCVDQLKGLGFQMGGSAGEAITGGADFVGGLDNDLKVSYTGGQVGIGLGAKVPFPGEVHVMGTLTGGWDSDNGWKN